MTLHLMLLLQKCSCYHWSYVLVIPGVIGSLLQLLWILRRQWRVGHCKPLQVPVLNVTVLNAEDTHELATNVLGAHSYCTYLLLPVSFLLTSSPTLSRFELRFLLPSPLISSSQPPSLPVLCIHLFSYMSLCLISVPIKVLSTSLSLFLFCLPLIMSSIPSKLPP